MGKYAANQTDYPEANNIKDSVNSIKQSASELAHHVYSDGRDVLTQAGEKAMDRFDGLRQSGMEELKKVETRVREKPAQSLAVAFAAGIILSFLFGRK